MTHLSRDIKNSRLINPIKIILIKIQRLSMIKIIKIMFIIIIFILCFISIFLLGTDYNDTINKLKIIFLSDFDSSQDIATVNKQQMLESLSNGPNATHLWSMRLADENYFRLARLLPCRTVEYVGGVQSDKMDSCNNSSLNEFSIPNILQAQKWIYEHQHPIDCSNKRFAIIDDFASSGFGSTIHQIAWAFGKALADNRIAVYQESGNWLYGDCNLGNPDCIFLPITNCSMPSQIDGIKTIRIQANLGGWSNPIHPPIFQNQSFNWYRSQLVFYITRYRLETLAHAQCTVAQYFEPSSIDLHHPYIAIYVRRSDKVKHNEMSQAYTLKQYFDLFDADAHRANISKVYINSEDEQVFNEFTQINKEKNGYYKLLTVKAVRNVIYSKIIHMSKRRLKKVVLDFLSDLFIEANADLHVGTLTSNWCRLVDEIRFVLGKTIPYYTPENKYLINW